MYKNTVIVGKGAVVSGMIYSRGRPYLYKGIGASRESLLTVWILINYGPNGAVYHLLYLIYCVYSRCHSRVREYFNTCI